MTDIEEILPLQSFRTAWWTISCVRLRCRREKDLRSAMPAEFRAWRCARYAGGQLSTTFIVHHQISHQTTLDAYSMAARLSATRVARQLTTSAFARPSFLSTSSRAVAPLQRRLFTVSAAGKAHFTQRLEARARGSVREAKRNVGTTMELCQAILVLFVPLQSCDSSL
jgi:hypothetical protein